MTVSFTTSWDTSPALGGWQHKQIISADRLEVDPALRTPDNRTSVKLFINDGDNIDGGARSEVDHLYLHNAELNETAYSGTQFIATSYWIPAGYNGLSTHGDGNAWSVLLQLHGPDAYSAPPAVSLHCGSIVKGGPKIWELALLGGNIKGVASATAYEWSDNAVVFNQWTQLVLGIGFSTSKSGSVQIWRRDAGATSFQSVINKIGVATLQYSGSLPAGQHYWKQGCYRGPSASGTTTLWFGPLARATTFADAVTSAFGS